MSLVQMALELCILTSRLAEQVKKASFHGHALDKGKAIETIGELIRQAQEAERILREE